MSETSEVVEKPEPEPAGENCEKEDGVSASDSTEKLSKRDSEISMLEDEEMPTYDSISSTTKPNNSVSTHEQRMDDVPPERDRSPSPEPSENQDNDDNESIYVVSSSAETDRPDDIEDEEEDYDSEDMNEEDEEEPTDEDEEDRDDYERDRYERESDEFEADRFERASDDFVLRHNDSMKKDLKERSQSLQDLATVEVNYDRRRNSRFQWERNLPRFKKNPLSVQSIGGRFDQYEQIGNKIKRHIQDRSEQNKDAEYEDYMMKKHREYMQGQDSNENRRATSTGGKQIKDYAEKVIKELERDEFHEGQNPTYATLERMENGMDQGPIALRLSSDRMSTGSSIAMEVDHSPTSRENDDKVRKVNGIIEFSEGSEVTCTPIIKGATLNRISEHVNGTEPARNSLNVRSLSYEEYMRGAAEEEAEVEIESNEICLISPEKPSYQNDPLTLNSHNRNNTNSLQITNVRTHRVVSEDDEIYEEGVQNSVKNTKVVNQTSETIEAENSEILMLKASLQERDAKFDCLQVAHQKTLADNMAMRQEIESLKKLLKEHEECQSREKKTAAIQTENYEDVDPQKLNALGGKSNHKISTSSINSAVSSIPHWSESTGSPGISIPFPDMRSDLNSDNSSVFENTPKKQPRTFSRAFITSTRILKTLSNITQRKMTASSPLVQGLKNRDDQVAITTDGPSTSGTSTSSKKRKADEMLEEPLEEEHFKIPQTSGSRRKKPNQDSGNETSQTNGLPSESENCKEDSKDGQEERGIDLGDNLKYYVYQDEEDSKDRSFLIQAEDPGNVPNQGIVRECGPYLLGNLEVRMTEVNGTINIWGKEINVESTGQEFEISSKSTEPKAGQFDWQKTLATNLINNSYLVSSNRKARPQSRFNDSNISKFSHSSGNSNPKCSPQANERSCHRRSSLTTDDNHDCSSQSRRLSWSGCKHLMEEQRHGCCSRNVEMNYDRCGCAHNARRYECHPCDRVQGCFGDTRRHSYSGVSPDSNHCWRAGNEDSCRHQTAHCQPSHSEEESCQRFPNQFHTSREFTHSYQPKHTSMKNESSGGSCCQNRTLPAQEEEDLLISPQKSSESPEIQKRRHSGQRVRGLLKNLLKGCGDCRTQNPANISKSSLRESMYKPSCAPEIVVTPCSPLASRSNQSPSMEKNRCCDTCSRRIEMAAEIEAQLEFFRVEMERLRSRSDALLDKLSILKFTDVQ